MRTAILFVLLATSVRADSLLSTLTVNAFDSAGSDYGVGNGITVEINGEIPIRAVAQFAEPTEWPMVVDLKHWNLDFGIQFFAGGSTAVFLDEWLTDGPINCGSSWTCNVAPEISELGAYVPSRLVVEAGEPWFTFSKFTLNGRTYQLTHLHVDFVAQLYGRPGQLVPEPSAVMLLAPIGLILSHRRRRLRR